MSKITVRADDDLVEQLEAREESKSQLVRDALRAYLDGDDREDGAGDDADHAAGLSDGHGSLDELVSSRVDELVDARLDQRLDAMVDARLDAKLARRQQDLNLTISLDGVNSGGGGSADVSDPVSDTVSAPDGAAVSDTGRSETETTCGQCGESVDDDHVFCPNCGEKAAHRAFCECGDEVRSDWAFCPSCGRRTPAAGVLDSS
ncbi:double zinc ribbon domain-containing protein [Haloarchaeobius sp. DT45]|uniref:double zinc ribbon domain-containing protein n=1 Tax=Haloarchaeobius sp. DT45 TaxID=3446116 RepID=UPI003F6D63EA